MTWTISIAVTVITALWLLFSSKRRIGTHNNKQEARELIALYETQPIVTDPAQQSEQEYRLYQELKRIQSQEHTASTQRLPLWICLLVITALSGATYAWYRLGGQSTIEWQRINTTLDAPLIRSQYLGQQPPTLPAEDLNTYCQLLQMRIERTEPNQLDNLARCYLQYNNFPYAAAVYHSLYRLAPDDDNIALNYAQSTLFARRNQPMSAEIEAILQRLIRHDPKDIMAQILLAAGYRQSGRNVEALPMWQALAQETDPNHPLYPMIKQALSDVEQSLSDNKESTQQANSINSSNGTSSVNQTTNNADTATIIHANIHISDALLAQTNAHSQLYLIASAVGSRMPVAVSRQSPQAEQSMTLSNADSMNKAQLSTLQTLTLRAKLSPDGNATSAPLAESEQTIALPLNGVIDIDLK